MKINVLRKRTLEKHKKTRFPAVRTFISASAVPTLESSQCRGTWRFLGCKRRAPISICQRSMSQNNNNSNNNSKPKKQSSCDVQLIFVCSVQKMLLLYLFVTVLRRVVCRGSVGYQHPRICGWDGDYIVITVIKAVAIRWSSIKLSCVVNHVPLMNWLGTRTII